MVTVTASFSLGREEMVVYWVSILPPTERGCVGSLCSCFQNYSDFNLVLRILQFRLNIVLLETWESRL